jgi:hypothetical protein
MADAIFDGFISKGGRPRSEVTDEGRESRFETVPSLLRVFNEMRCGKRLFMGGRSSLQGYSQMMLVEVRVEGREASSSAVQGSLSTPAFGPKVERLNRVRPLGSELKMDDKRVF